MENVNVLIGSYLEPHLVERIRAVDLRLDVHYHPELLPKPRYVADHIGQERTRSGADQARWEALLGQADVMFDFDYGGLAELPDRAPRVRWIQASSAGIGQMVVRYGLERMQAVFTTASGVHTGPLAEFVLMAMLQHTKNAALARQQQHEHVWKRFATRELAGSTLAIVGYGRIGTEVARIARAFGMRVIANKVRTDGLDPADLGLDALYAWSELHAMLAQADFVCLITPHTSDTEGLMNDAAFAHIKPGAVLINIARGIVVDTQAMLAALASGRLAHAVLDVTLPEPLPPDSPLWDHPGITIYPHSASTGEHQNERLTQLFCENLRRFLAGRPLLNQLDIERMY